MLNVTMYGRPSSTYEYAKYAILNKAKEANIELNLSEISDERLFISDRVESIPAVRIGDDIRS